MTPEQFLTFADPLPEPMLLLTSSGLVLAGNRAVERRLGLALHEARGKHLADVVADSADEIAHYHLVKPPQPKAVEAVLARFL